MNSEIWKDIEGYEKLYKVSNYGDVYSERKKIVLVKDNSDPRYMRTTLCKNGVCKRFSIARLVAKTFIPNPYNKKTVNHINGNGCDNNVSNLEWATQSENIKHKFYVLGYKIPQSVKDKRSLIRGNKHPSAKLTENDVIKIKRKIMLGFKNVDLAKEYGVTAENICAIKTGKTWNWLEDKEVNKDV